MAIRTFYYCQTQLFDAPVWALALRASGGSFSHEPAAAQQQQPSGATALCRQQRRCASCDGSRAIGGAAQQPAKICTTNTHCCEDPPVAVCKSIVDWCLATRSLALKDLAAHTVGAERHRLVHNMLRGYICVFGMRRRTAGTPQQPVHNIVRKNY
jgi:hypothetical protein